MADKASPLRQQWREEGFGGKHTIHVPHAARTLALRTLRPFGGFPAVSRPQSEDSDGVGCVRVVARVTQCARTFSVLKYYLLWLLLH